MGPGERLRLEFEISAFAWKWLDVPDAAAGDRKLAAWQRERDLSNEIQMRDLLWRDSETSGSRLLGRRTKCSRR